MGKGPAERQRGAPMVWRALDGVPDPLVVVDSRGQIAFANREATALFGYSPEALVGQPLHQLLPRENLPSLDERAVTGYAPSHGWRTLGVCADGRSFPVEVRRGQLELAGRACRVLTLRDLSFADHLEAERNHLLLYEQAIARIAQSLVDQTDLAAVIDLLAGEGTRILDFDVVAFWLADVPRRTLTLVAERGGTVEVIDRLRQVPFDAPYIIAEAARERRTRAIPDLTEAPDLSPESREAAARGGLLSLLAVPIFNKRHLLGVVFYGSRQPRTYTAGDLAFHRALADLFAVSIENARLYGELNQALKLREEFVAAAGHELKTPVTVIKGRTQLLLKEASGEKTRKALQTIERQTDRITSLIDDLLAIVRLRPGLSVLKREVVDLGVLLRQRVEVVARTTDHHEFRARVAEGLLVNADLPLIREVIGHLLENAIRYSPGGGLIEVTAQRRGDEALVEVADHGVGIPRERQPYVFEPFYEAIPAGLPGYSGLVSLGLYLSKQIVNAHGGQLWLVSAPGQGSTFGFTLPLVKPSKAESPESEGGKPAS